uniref:Large ribosomal subunit protein uL1 n=1 Tax=Dermatophagoides pteronyssinus TaxID=6956 RepID=A0A6P6YBN0_DERPT|nr:60S ribosomal protein L10a-like [Dermatophagoides pteronyssinus]
MSKLSQQVVEEAVRAVLNPEKKRNFLESIDLQIVIKDYDLKRDKRFNGTIRLPHVISPNRKVCVLGTDVHCEEAKNCGLTCLNVAAMEAINMNAKVVKKLAKKYHYFMCSSSLITMIPKYFGPTLNKLGKFPAIITPNDKLADKSTDLKATVKFVFKKDTSLGVAIGNVNMTEQELTENLHTAINFLVSLTKKNWHNIKTMHIRSAMGKPRQIYP